MPYQCNQCNMGFSRESFLKQHQEKHLSKQDWIWNCRICPQNFPSETRYVYTIYKICKNRQLLYISLFSKLRRHNAEISSAFATLELFLLTLELQMNPAMV